MILISWEEYVRRRKEQEKSLRDDYALNVLEKERRLGDRKV